MWSCSSNIFNSRGWTTPRCCVYCKQALTPTCAQLWRSADYGVLPQVDSRTDNLICRRCLSALPLIFPWRDVITRQFYTQSDLYFSSKFDQATVALADYLNPLKQSLLRLKFHDEPFESVVLAEVLHTCLPSFSSGQPVYIVPLPLSDTRLRERGYNQVELILSHLKPNRNIRVSKLLVKSRDTARQSEIGNRMARIRNVEGAFRLNREVTSVDKTAKIVLFDDVITTAATILEARKTLMEAGYQHICCLALMTRRVL